MSDSLKDLKERIYDEGTVGQLLAELGCEDIVMKSGRSGDDLVTARETGSKNPRGIQVYLSPQLNSSIVNRGISGDIYAIVGYILFDCMAFDDVKSKLYQITTYIRNVLGYEHTNDFKQEKPKTDWNWWLRDIQKQRPREYEVVENRILNNNILDEFYTLAWKEWFDEGISISAQNHFGVGFHIPSDRVTIPVHNAKGELIGIKGRYVGKDKEQLEHKKYNYIYSCSKTIELFNLHRALPYIKESKKVYVFEGAKTTMKLWGWNIKNTVSIEGDRLSPIQAKMLRELGIDINIVFSFDKDKSLDYAIKQTSQIKNRDIGYLYDESNIFADKQSPADLGFEKFMYLSNNNYIKIN